MSTIREWLTEHRGEYPDDRYNWLRDCQKELGVTLRAVQNVGAKLWPVMVTEQQRSSPKPEESDVVGRTLEDFRKEHDQSWKIRDGLKRLFREDIIMTDAEFREAVRGNPTRWRAAADSTEFSRNRYKVQGELLWANEDTILEMRRIRGEVV